MLSCGSSVIVKRNLHRKKNVENFDFVEIFNFIRGSTEVGFRVCSVANSQENVRGGALF